jgi:formylglycine-generating enzyme required for sulfatase activity
MRGKALRLLVLLAAAAAVCAAQTCPQDQPKGVNPPVLAPQGHGVCRYDRPAPQSQPSYWWQLLYELFQWKPVSQPPFRRSVAFLAGVSQYANIRPQLDFVKNDLTEFRNFLLTDGGFDTVYEVRDGNVTPEVFTDFMRKYFSDQHGLIGPEDRLLVYYSGHGGAQADSEPYLLFQRAMPGDYTRDVLAVREIYGWARTTAAKHLLIILDSCFSGLVADSSKPGPGDMAVALSNALAGEPSALLLTAGTGAEEAYAVRYSKEKNGSIFTHALIDALRSMSQSEGIVTIGEAFERAKVSVAAFDAVENRKMTPLRTPLVGRNGIGKGNFIFINTKAQNPALPSGLSGRGTLIAKAPDAAVDQNLQLIQLEYEEVKNSDDLSVLRLFVGSYKGKPYGQTLVGLIEARINRIEHPTPPAPVSQPVVLPPEPVAGKTMVNPKDGLTYVWIAPGSFLMGCSPGDTECDTDEKPARRVSIAKGFWIGQTPATVGAWKKYRSAMSLSALPGADDLGRKLNENAGDDRLPAVALTWDEAKSYCEWGGGRLPTEPEWEYAARAGSTAARYGNLDDIAWYGDNSGTKRIDSLALWNADSKGYLKKLFDNGNGPKPVGLKRPNAWSLYDTLGNVWEWTADWYEEGKTRSLRGGSWVSVPRDMRVSVRYGDRPGNRGGVVGVRCVRE